MHVIKQKTIVDYCRKQSLGKDDLYAWYHEAKASSWRTPQDIKDRYVSASFLSENRVVFNIHGNSLRLVVKVEFTKGLVFILGIYTHSEYDRLKLEG